VITGPSNHRISGQIETDPKEKSGASIRMKILVPIKRVVDYNVKVRPKSDGTDVDLANVKMSINPFCEIAVEEAIRIKEGGGATEIIVVSIGPAKAQEQLRSAMALGADRAILVESDTPLEPLAVAKCLKNIVDKEQPGLILMGKQSIDGDNNQTGQMLAALCGYPQATFASQVTVTENTATVTREVDGGLETLKVQIPAVITTDLRLNEPRFAALPNIMKAKRKPLEIRPLSDLGIDTKPRTQVLAVESPPERSGGIKVADVDALIEKLKNEAKVI
jgi:Electron transfer flavoprotein, beta subunit